MGIGKNVRKIRELRGMSQARLAEEMTTRGVGTIYPQTVTKIENESRSVNLLEGVHIAEILDVAVEDLLTGVEPVPRGGPDAREAELLQLREFRRAVLKAATGASPRPSYGVGSPAAVFDSGGWFAQHQDQLPHRSRELDKVLPPEVRERLAKDLAENWRRCPCKNCKDVEDRP